MRGGGAWSTNEIMFCFYAAVDSGAYKIRARVCARVYASLTRASDRVAGPGAAVGEQRKCVRSAAYSDGERAQHDGVVRLSKYDSAETRSYSHFAATTRIQATVARRTNGRLKQRGDAGYPRGRTMLCGKAAPSHERCKSDRLVSGMIRGTVKLAICCGKNEYRLVELRWG